MKQLKIRTKFILLGVLGTVALSFIVYLALNISKLGLDSLDKVYSDSKEVQNIQQELIAPIFYLRELSLSLVVAPNDEIRNEINLELEPLVITLEKRFNKSSLEIKNEWIDYKEVLRITQRFAKEGFEEGAFINVNKDEREQFYILVQKLQAIQTNALKKSLNTFEEVRNIISQNRITILLVSSILGFFILVLGWFIITKIANAIEQVKAGHSRFFEFLKNKKQDEILGITLNTNDELGDMARAINEEMEEIKVTVKQDAELIKSAINMLSKIKQGHTNERLYVEAKSDELNSLKMVINEMVSDLENRIQQEIDHRTAQEKLLIQQSKLAAMGNMIGNIAHQWRQPLSEINAILMNIETRYKFNAFDENFIENSVNECNEITSYMSQTISDFQNFFKPSKTKEPFYVVEACKKAGGILQASLKYNTITYNCEFDEDKKVHGYPNEFAQAFLNILNNAKDVLIQRNIKNPYINVSIISGKKYVLIKVSDNAGGIKEEHLDRIFEPYFTTKHAKQGTGIGLYMSKTIIEGNMDGILNVHNTNEGACFTIKLK